MDAARRPSTAVTDDEPWVALLPSLDSTAMGWKQREWYLGEWAAFGGPLFDTNGNVGPTVWANGEVVGGWAQRRDGRVVHELLRPVDPATRRAIDDAALHDAGAHRRGARLTPLPHPVAEGTRRRLSYRLTPAERGDERRDRWVLRAAATSDRADRATEQRFVHRACEPVLPVLGLRGGQHGPAETEAHHLHQHLRLVRLHLHHQRRADRAQSTIDRGAGARVGGEQQPRAPLRGRHAGGHAGRCVDGEVVAQQRDAVERGRRPRGRRTRRRRARCVPAVPAAGRWARR